MPAGYEEQFPDPFAQIGGGASPTPDQQTQLRDAFAQMMMQQQLQGATSNRDMQAGQGLPPFNGMGEQALPQAGGAMMPQGPQSPMPQQQQQMGQPPMGTPGGAPSPQDLMALQQLMQGAASNNDMRQMKPPGAYSLPPSPGAGRFNI